VAYSIAGLRLRLRLLGLELGYCMVLYVSVYGHKRHNLIAIVQGQQTHQPAATRKHEATTRACQNEERARTR
jgi:hypothetical protein